MRRVRDSASCGSARGGVPRTQKLRTTLVGARSYRRVPLTKPVVGQNVALRAVPADRTSAYLVSAFPNHSTSLFFFPNFTCSPWRSISDTEMYYPSTRWWEPRAICVCVCGACVHAWVCVWCMLLCIIMCCGCQYCIFWVYCVYINYKILVMVRVLYLV